MFPKVCFFNFFVRFIHDLFSFYVVFILIIVFISSSKDINSLRLNATFNGDSTLLVRDHHPPTHPFTHPPTHSPTHPPIHPPTHSHIHPPFYANKPTLTLSIHPFIHHYIFLTIHLFIHSSIHPPIHLFSYSLITPFIHPLILSLIFSFIHPPITPFIHPLIPSLIDPLLKCYLQKKTTTPPPPPILTSLPLTALPPTPQPSTQTSLATSLTNFPKIHPNPQTTQNPPIKTNP